MTGRPDLPEQLSTPRAATERCARWRKEGHTIGLVPTMGALHEGHLSLARAARAENDRVVVSIFVNPLQFGAGEDLDRYPRDLSNDTDMLRDVGVDAIFTTTPEQMYPAGFSTYVVNDAAASRFEGEVRPGHFRGVLTVVAKLFHIVPADVSYFGQKDAQQAMLIQRMVRELNFDMKVRVLPTVREPDGLALSSRNAYLSAEARQRARCLSRGLNAARALFDAGERDVAALLDAARNTISSTTEITVDYIALVDAATFEPVDDRGRVTADALLLVAAKVDGTRLIDNLMLNPHLGADDT